MKKLMMSFAVMMTLVAAANAEARSLKFKETSTFTKFDFQNASSLSEKKIRQGSVTVSHATNSITIVLNPAFYCPPNMMCAQVMPRPIEYTAQNMQATQGNCGETIYSALTDKLPVDGLRVEITVVDHSTDHCKYFAPVAATETKLELTYPRGPNGGPERHQFEGNKLN